MIALKKRGICVFLEECVIVCNYMKYYKAFWAQKKPNGDVGFLMVMCTLILICDLFKFGLNL
jgi:hypothetical protein